MNFIKLKLDDATYQYLKDRFDGDVNLIEDFIKKMLSKEIKKIRLDPNDLDKKNTSDIMENYLKSGKSGSRSYGVKGQGW